MRVMATQLGAAACCSRDTTKNGQKYRSTPQRRRSRRRLKIQRQIQKKKQVNVHVCVCVCELRLRSWLRASILKIACNNCCCTTRECCNLVACVNVTSFRLPFMQVPGIWHVACGKLLHTYTYVEMLIFVCVLWQCQYSSDKHATFGG